MKFHALPVTILALITIVLGAAGAVPAPQSPMANGVVLIIRHAEKPKSGTGLTPAGQQRAAAYVSYFEKYRIGSKVRPPDVLIATADTDSSHRERLTLEPLGKALGLPIDVRFQEDDVVSLANTIQTHPGGKTILICWHHGKIPALLQALGADPDALLPQGKWPSKVFNWVIQLPYDRNGHLIAGQAQRIDEHLLPGDATSTH
ncbi:MAG: flagellar basal body-associated protein FliL [Capsulimonadaceae bacterium]